MNVAVMGAGGVGGYLGGMLARAGNSVTLIARGDHLAAIRGRGLRVNSEKIGDFTVQVSATDNPRALEPVELVLFTVKTYHNAQAMEIIMPLVGKNTAILILQNGVDGYQQLSQRFGAERVLPGVIYIETQVESPGVIRQRGSVVRVVFGEARGGESPRVRAIARAFNDAGVQAEVAQDVLKALWTKFLFIVTLAGVTTVVRAEMDELLRFPESRRLIQEVITETEGVARARGIRLEHDIKEKTMAYLEKEAKALHASMHTDLERGKLMELEALNGAVVRMGKELGIPTPANSFIYAILHVHDMRARGGKDA